MPKVRWLVRRAASLSLLLWTLVARAELQFQFDFKDIIPGVDQAQLKMKTKDGPWSIFVVRVDRSRSDLKIRPVLATELGKAVLPLSKLAAGFKLEGWQTVVAMNANLFTKGAGGSVAGLHIADGEVCSAPAWNYCSAVWADHAGRLHMAWVTNGFSLTWPDGRTTALYLDATSHTNSPTIFAGHAKCLAPHDAESRLVLHLEGASAPLLPPNATRRARIMEGTACKADAANELLLIPGPSFRGQAQRLRSGDVFTVGLGMSCELNDAVWAVSAGPQLLRGGNKHGYFSQPPPPDKIPERAPRSLVGFNERSVFFVVVDGRQPGKSIGMDFSELCQLMQQLGCTDALNMDGGGSATMWVEGKVVNSPSERLRLQRPIANALLVMRRAD